MNKKDLLDLCVKEARVLTKPYIEYPDYSEFPLREEWELALVLFGNRLWSIYEIHKKDERTIKLPAVTNPEPDLEDENGEE